MWTSNRLLRLTSLMMFLGCICRWDDSWANESIIHGRNLDGVGQLHHIPNSKMLVPVLPCHGRHHHDVPSTTSSWNFRALRWRCSALWRSSCISRPTRARSRVFWSLRVQVPWSKRHCGFSAGGELAPLPSPRMTTILPCKIDQKSQGPLYTTEVESSKKQAFSLAEGSLLLVLVHSSPLYT